MTEAETAVESDIQKRLVQVTIQLLADDGPEALQVRRIASAAGVSSMMLYSRFGGMPNLVEAVIEQGFRQLAERFAALEPTNDPVADMSRLAIEYHQVGRENPHLFDLMFGLSTPGGYRQLTRPTRTPGADAGTALDDVYRPLVSHARRAIRDKRIRRADPDRISAEIWAFVHGFTVLELGGYFSQFEDPIVEVLKPLTTHLAVGLGDTPQRAARSVAAAVAASKA